MRVAQTQCKAVTVCCMDTACVPGRGGRGTARMGCAVPRPAVLDPHAHWGAGPGLRGWRVGVTSASIVHPCGALRHARVVFYFLVFSFSFVGSACWPWPGQQGACMACFPPWTSRSWIGVRRAGSWFLTFIVISISKKRIRAGWWPGHPCHAMLLPPFPLPPPAPPNALIGLAHVAPHECGAHAACTHGHSNRRQGPLGSPLTCLVHPSNTGWAAGQPRGRAAPQALTLLPLRRQWGRQGQWELTGVMSSRRRHAGGIARGASRMNEPSSVCARACVHTLTLWVW